MKELILIIKLIQDGETFFEVMGANSLTVNNLIKVYQMEDDFADAYVYSNSREFLLDHLTTCTAESIQEYIIDNEKYRISHA
ncbi:hypothetical protein AVV44_gp129 [Cronobacter phage S13]|jgi:hypothetical protein|uniref:Uncharacterized protein n=1 Tax=Cronobacter phage LPCS28 TaxID=2924885 RepID=A0AAE9G820_9CAUD|nr:hypothetical protein AVV44_gp129 [Cronobacter phage S13]YP_010665982.1 hypothetical protein PQB73_gp042 [Cronobacter phage LPCS28]AIA64928.1 hypothetical protein S13_129 [Cronobacter phage S13]UNY47171.1 hypothetical protein EHEKIMEA_00289 [Cronobacter phage LPCS28]